MFYEVTVEILNWNKYNGRSDVINPQWFRFNNNFFNRGDLFKMDNATIVLWLFVLSLASSHQVATVSVTSSHAVATLRAKFPNILKRLQVLEKIGFIKIIRNACVTSTCSTLQDNTIHVEEGIKKQKSAALKIHESEIIYQPWYGPMNTLFEDYYNYPPLEFKKYYPKFYEVCGGDLEKLKIEFDEIVKRSEKACSGDAIKRRSWCKKAMLGMVHEVR